MRRTANSLTVPALLAAAHLVLALLLFSPTPYEGGDNAIYESLAKSLLQRHAYLDLYLPDTPPHANFPPFFPLLLAGAMAVGITSWVGLKLVSVVISAAAVAASYAWLRRATTPRVALWAGVILAASPGVLFWTDAVLSDIPFWALTMVALAAFETRAKKVTGRRAAVGIVAVVLAYFTRAAGLPLAIATALWLARHDWRRLFLFLAVLLPLAVAWGARDAPLGGSYLQVAWLRDPYDAAAGTIGLSELPARIAANAARISGLQLPTILVGDSLPAAIPFGVVIVALAILWWVRRCRHPRVADLFLPLYLGLLLIWPPAYSDDRFLLPLFPILLGYAGYALLFLTRRLRAPWRRVARIAAPALLLLVVALPALVQRIGWSFECTQRHLAGQRHACLPDNWRDFYRVAENARFALPADAVVLSRKPALFYSLSGRQGAIYPFSENPDSLVIVAERNGATFLVFDRLSTMMDRYLAPALSHHADRFCVRTDLSLPLSVMLEIHPPSNAPMAQRPEQVILPICRAGRLTPRPDRPTPP